MLLKGKNLNVFVGNGERLTQLLYAISFSKDKGEVVALLGGEWQWKNDTHKSNYESFPHERSDDSLRGGNFRGQKTGVRIGRHITGDARCIDSLHVPESLRRTQSGAPHRNPLQINPWSRRADSRMHEFRGSRWPEWNYLLYFR